MTKKLFLTFITLIVIGGISTAQQTESDLDYLSSKEAVLGNYQQDFISFTKTNDTLEYEIAMGLTNVADKNHERIDAAYALVNVYENMTCENDRMFVKSSLKKQLLYYMEGIDIDIKDINNALAHTKLPAISQTAIRMKDDPRDVKTKMNAYANRLS